MPSEFIEYLKTHQATFGISLDDTQINKLTAYYYLIQQNNELLHLVAPMAAEEFAIRHILESLSMLEHLPLNSRFADVGAGAGLPSIPCLIARDDLKAVLIESKAKKAKFLTEAVENLGISLRTSIVNAQFEEARPDLFSIVACRALDKFTEKLPKLVKWSGKRKLLFFGGDKLRNGLRKQGLKFAERLLPLSDQRYLFVIPVR